MINDSVFNSSVRYLFHGDPVTKWSSLSREASEIFTQQLELQLWSCAGSAGVLATSKPRGYFQGCSALTSETMSALYDAGA